MASVLQRGQGNAEGEKTWLFLRDSGVQRAYFSLRPVGSDGDLFLTVTSGGTVVVYVTERKSVSQSIRLSKQDLHLVSTVLGGEVRDWS